MKFIILLIVLFCSCSPAKKQPKPTGRWEYNDPNDGEKLVWVVDSINKKQ